MSFLAQDLFNVNGIVAVITGGGSGIGAYMAQALDANGAAKVYILGRRKEKLEAIAKTSKSGSIIPIECDASSKGSLESAASTIASQTPFINLLIANAGISGPVAAFPHIDPKLPVSDVQKLLWNTGTPNQFQDLFNTNLLGAYYTFLAFVNLLEAGNTHADSTFSKSGLIQSQFITTSSNAAYYRQDFVSQMYQSVKAGLIQLTKILSTTFAKHGIRVNSIAPGTVKSELTSMLGENISELGSFDKDFIPSTRAGGPEDIAGTILYMASRAGAFMNGNILLLDGGAVSVISASY